MFIKKCEWCHKTFRSEDDTRWCSPLCSVKWRSKRADKDNDAFQDFVEEEIVGQPHRPHCCRRYHHGRIHESN